jgi:hypothetical protein
VPLPLDIGQYAGLRAPQRHGVNSRSYKKELKGILDSIKVVQEIGHPVPGWLLTVQ